MTIAFAWSQVSTTTRQVDTGDSCMEQRVITAAGCDSLSGGRSQITSHQVRKYMRFQDNLVFFSGSMPMIQRIRTSDVLQKALGLDPDYSLYEYHERISKWSAKKDKDAGISGVTTMVVNGMTGEISTVLGCGSVVEADAHREVVSVDDLPKGTCRDSTVFRLAAIGGGASIAIGAIDVNVIQHGGLDCSRSERELCLMILRAAERHDKHCGGVPRVFSSSFIDLGGLTDDSEVKWEFLSGTNSVPLHSGVMPY